MDMTRTVGAPWLMAAMLTAGAVAAPGLQSQEVDSAGDSDETGDRLFSVSAGARLELFGVASPGASLRATWAAPKWVWFSLELLAQMVRWNVQYDALTRRDHLYLGRLAAGIGTGEGPSAFVFYEKGEGVIRTEPAFARGDTYRLTGIGLGAGYTFERVTIMLDLSVGGGNRSSPDLYALYGMSLRYRLF